MATPVNPWSAPSPHAAAAQPAGGEELGLEARPMGLKVHYTFDKEAALNCLARWPHILQIQTIPLDERTTIGVVDLRTCLQAIAQCSPEIVNQQEIDYSVYAYDYSEPDVPLVGQGMLSWGLDQQNETQQQQQQQQQPQLVTGRVTRNVFAILSNGSRETLEVKLKLTAVARIAPRSEYPSVEPANGVKSALTPADATSEWNSFIQSNPMLGHASNVGSISSPGLAPAQLSQFPTSMSDSRSMEVRNDNRLPQPIRPASIPPPNTLPPVPIPPLNKQHSLVPAPARAQVPTENAASPVSQPMEFAPQPRPSRPASRSRSKQPTGRPRGRPRKKPLETGNTSAAEEATDGDEGPQKKRAKVVRTEYSPIAPFGAVPETSLRVAASTSGSLRAMRPVGAGGDASVPNHLQDHPRAPTPVPDGALLQQQQRRRLDSTKARSDSMVSMDQSGPGRSGLQNLSQDARSPAESIAQSPDHGYSPEGSAGDLGSSPPVPRTTAYIQSSPPALSPILPPMPSRHHVDSGFMSGGLDDFFDDEDMLHDLTQGQIQEDQMLPAPSLPVPSKPNNRKHGRAQSQPKQQQQPAQFPFQEVNPGPPELLPTKSIFNPAGKAKTLNRPTPPPSTQPAPKKAASRPLKRSHTAPNPVVSEQEPFLQGQPVNQHNGNGLAEPPAQVYESQEQNSFSNGATGSTQPVGQSAENGYAEPFKQEDASTCLMSMPIPERPEIDPVLTLPTGPPSRPASRPASRGVPAPPVPASDPVAEPALTLPRPFMSEAPCPPSDIDPPRYSKNLVKKQSIKERLESAILKGESPPFCNNCGAIETPTWRKIWTQEHQGVPAFHEFSDKPGAVTMIEVLERDPEGQPSMYRIVKKNLGPQDDKKKWTETLLCNPCGIWLGKFKVHRPSDRWDKDAARLNQPRKKRENKGNNSRSKKARTKSDAKPNPTSEAYFTTDPIGPADHESPKELGENEAAQSRQQSMAIPEENENFLNLRSSPKQRLPGSTHSRGSGTADSPIAVEDDLGSTRRLLFPSPRKDGVPKVLGELAVNKVQQASTGQEAKSAATGKENQHHTNKPHPERSGTPVPDDTDHLEHDLFGTPPRRPSTPPPKASAGPFKTPTRPTPSHRPITRSISRSIRSIRTTTAANLPPKSPGQLLFSAHHPQRTPSKTPRSVSGGKRRSPRHNNNSSNSQHLHAHFAIDDVDLPHHMQFDSPFTATLNQLLSEANEFTAGSPSHGLEDLDLRSVHLQHQGQAQQGGQIDFGNFLSAQAGDLGLGGMGLMPSSPPLLRRGGGGGGDGGLEFGGVLAGGGGNGGEEMWASLGEGVGGEGR